MGEGVHDEGAVDDLAPGGDVREVSDPAAVGGTGDRDGHRAWARPSAAAQARYRPHGVTGTVGCRPNSPLAARCSGTPSRRPATSASCRVPRSPFSLPISVNSSAQETRPAPVRRCASRRPSSAVAHVPRSRSARDDVGRDRLDRVVAGEDRVVVLLPGVGDAVLGDRQLLLCLPLVRGLPADGFHALGDQIVAPLELYLDLGPRRCPPHRVYGRDRCRARRRRG